MQLFGCVVGSIKAALTDVLRTQPPEALLATLHFRLFLTIRFRHTHEAFRDATACRECGNEVSEWTVVLVFCNGMLFCGVAVPESGPKRKCVHDVSRQAFRPKTVHRPEVSWITSTF